MPLLILVIGPSLFESGSLSVERTVAAVCQLKWIKLDICRAFMNQLYVQKRIFFFREGLEIANNSNHIPS